MTVAKPSALPKIPPAPRAPREPMSRMESVYFGLLVHWYKHRKAAPSLDELAALCRPRKSRTSVRSALLSLESKGYVLRNEEGQFEVTR